MDYVSFTDFSKLDFRVGEIVEADKVEGSGKLIKMLVDFGELGKKTVFSGIYFWYKPEELLGKQSVFIINIEPKKIMGQLSEAMIFAPMDDEKDDMSILLMDKNMKNGIRVI